MAPEKPHMRGGVGVVNSSYVTGDKAHTYFLIPARVQMDQNHIDGPYRTKYLSSLLHRKMSSFR